MAAAKRATVNELLLARVREALSPIRRVEEKRMFGGVMFMVNGKMCISVGKNRLMCRIDPALHDEAIRREGCRTVTMGGRTYLGYVHVDASAAATKKALTYWVNLALSYNAQLRDTRSKKR
jgi:TfoX/Sxy family transcriptional regulator of competence genes